MKGKKKKIKKYPEGGPYTNPWNPVDNNPHHYDPRNYDSDYDPNAPGNIYSTPYSSEIGAHNPFSDYSNMNWNSLMGTFMPFMKTILKPSRYNENAAYNDAVNNNLFTTNGYSFSDGGAVNASNGLEDMRALLGDELFDSGYRMDAEGAIRGQGGGYAGTVNDIGALLNAINNTSKTVTDENPNIAASVNTVSKKSIVNNSRQNRFFTSGYQDVANSLGLESKDDVRALQEKIGLRKDAVDGIFGPQTSAALAAHKVNVAKYTPNLNNVINPSIIQPGVRDSNTNIDLSLGASPVLAETANSHVDPDDKGLDTLLSLIPGNAYAKGAKGIVNYGKNFFNIGKSVGQQTVNGISVTRNAAGQFAKIKDTRGGLQRIKEAASSASSKVKDALNTAIEKGQKLKGNKYAKLSDEGKAEYDKIVEQIIESSKATTKSYNNFLDDAGALFGEAGGAARAFANGGNIPKYNNGGEISLMPVQTEKGEFILFQDGTISKVKAKDKHKNMKDDEVTDVLPEGSYVTSARKKMKLSKSKAEDISFGYTTPLYEENKIGDVPEEVMFSDIFKKKQHTPAELTEIIQKKFPVTDRDKDAFAEFTKKENKESRMPYLKALVSMSEEKKPKKKRQFAMGGGINNNINQMDPIFKNYNSALDHHFDAFDVFGEMDNAMKSQQYPRSLFATNSNMGMKGPSFFPSLNFNSKPSAFANGGNIPKLDGGGDPWTAIIQGALGPILGGFNYWANRGNIKNMKQAGLDQYNRLMKNNTQSSMFSSIGNLLQEGPRLLNETANQNDPRRRALASYANTNTNLDRQYNNIQNNTFKGLNALGKNLTFAGVNPTSQAGAIGSQIGNILRAGNDASGQVLNSRSDNFANNQNFLGQLDQQRNAVLQNHVDQGINFRNNRISSLADIGVNQVNRDSNAGQFLHDSILGDQQRRINSETGWAEAAGAGINTGIATYNAPQSNQASMFNPGLFGQSMFGQNNQSFSPQGNAIANNTSQLSNLAFNTSSMGSMNKTNSINNMSSGEKKRLADILLTLLGDENNSGSPLTGVGHLSALGIN